MLVGMKKPTENEPSAACARRAARDAAVQPPPQAAAPLLPSVFAASGLRTAGDGEGRAGGSPRHSGQTRRSTMTEDAELDVFRQAVSCAAVLETMTGGWRLDKRESTRRALKSRRGAGEIVLVNHDGRGWWDATGTAKGDVFNLVQHLDPSLNFGQVRRVLRGLVGIAPANLEVPRKHVSAKADKTPAERWAARKRLTRGDAAWSYLTGSRSLSARVLIEASAQDAVRLGAYGSAWFAHVSQGQVTHVEIRSPTFKGSLTGGRKTLFRFGLSGDSFTRLAVLEAPIDALSLAALEQLRADTLYVATGGGMGSGTLEALTQALATVPLGVGVLVSAADANAAGDRYAARHEELAAAAKVAFARLRPPEGSDWNDVLVRGRKA